MKWIRLTLKALMLLLALFLLGFSLVEQKKVAVQSLEIKPDYESSGLYLISVPEIEAQILSEAPDIVGKELSLINTELLEEMLKTDPYVKSAEVYSTLRGVLIAEIEQRKPVLRVLPKGKPHYYLDADGHPLPLSPHFSASVRLFHAEKPKENQEAFLFLNRLLAQDEFLNSMFSEVIADANGHFTLIPSIGSQQVLLGSLDNIDTKLHKLKWFYKKAMTSERWEQYTSIDLRFDNQVVCEKKQ